MLLQDDGCLTAGRPKAKSRGPRKLVPFLAAQDTFKAQAEAKYLADELEAKLAPAEVRHGETW